MAAGADGSVSLLKEVEIRQGPLQWGHVRPRHRQPHTAPSRAQLRGGYVYATGSSAGIGRGAFSFYREEALAPFVVTQVACGAAHSAALTSDGVLFTWGTNGGGGACHPSAVRDIKTPRQVTCLHR